MRRFWAAEDLQLLRWLYPHVLTAKVANLLERSIRATYGRAKIEGLRKTREFLASAESGLLRKGEQREASKATQFKPGQVPPNKGLRRPGYAPGRMAQTQFKKGRRSGKAAENWVPIGTIRTDTEGYQRIKVREAVYGKEASGFGNTKVWPLLNRYVWEQHRGPIPPDHAVCFKDGKRANCEIENLECISRAELARRNVMWTRYPRDLALAIQLNGALKRKMRRIAREQYEKQNDRPA